MIARAVGGISGVPDYVFGVQLGRPANETERVLFAGQAKVNRFRRNVETALAVVGLPIKFSGEPFVTRNERINAILNEYEKGVATLNEVRTALGRPEVAEGGGFFQAVKMMLGLGGN